LANASRTLPLYSQAINIRINKPHLIIEFAGSTFAKIDLHQILNTNCHVSINAQQMHNVSCILIHGVISKVKSKQLHGKASASLD
jgi:hypothetical protein